jgi:hypothetical protein
MDFRNLSEIEAFSAQVRNAFPAAPSHPFPFNSQDWTRVSNITLKGRQVFSLLEATQMASAQAHLDACTQLRNSLDSVTARIQRTKTIFQRVISLFVYLCQEERELNLLCKAVQKMEAKERRLVNYIWLPSFFRIFISNSRNFVNRVYKWFESFDDRSIKGRLSQAYHRVIGKERVSTSLEGRPTSVMLNSVGQDVEEFAERYANHLDPSELARLKKLRHQLEFAETFRRELDFITPSPQTEERFLADLFYDIQKKIVAMAPGDSLMIPGGYASEDSQGHAVIYKIDRDANSKYRFTLINTGDGAVDNDNEVLLDALKKLLSEETFQTNRELIERFAAKGQLFLFLQQGKILPHLQIADKMIEDLELEQLLDPSFFIPILQQNRRKKGYSMKAIDQLIVEKLCRGNRMALKNGPTHSLQANGTCTYESIRIWLYQSLRVETFRAVDLFCIAKGIDRLESVMAEAGSHDWEWREIRGSWITDECNPIVEGDSSSHELQSIWKVEKYEGLAFVKKLKEIGQSYFQKRREGLNSYLSEQSLAVRQQMAEVQQTLNQRVDAVADEAIGSSSSFAMQQQQLKDRIRSYEVEIEQLKQIQLLSDSIALA